MLLAVELKQRFGDRMRRLAEEETAGLDLPPSTKAFLVDVGLPARFCVDSMELELEFFDFDDGTTCMPGATEWFEQAWDLERVWQGSPPRELASLLCLARIEDTVLAIDPNGRVWQIPFEEAEGFSGEPELTASSLEQLAECLLVLHEADRRLQTWTEGDEHPRAWAQERLSATAPEVAADSVWTRALAWLSTPSEDAESRAEHAHQVSRGREALEGDPQAFNDDLDAVLAALESEGGDFI